LLGGGHRSLATVDSSLGRRRYRVVPSEAGIPDSPAPEQHMRTAALYAPPLSSSKLNSFSPSPAALSAPFIMNFSAPKVTHPFFEDPTKTIPPRNHPPRFDNSLAAVCCRHLRSLDRHLGAEAGKSGAESWRSVASVAGPPRRQNPRKMKDVHLFPSFKDNWKFECLPSSDIPSPPSSSQIRPCSSAPPTEGPQAATHKSSPSWSAGAC